MKEGPNQDVVAMVDIAAVANKVAHASRVRACNNGDRETRDDRRKMACTSLPLEAAAAAIFQPKPITLVVPKAKLFIWV